MNHENQTFWNSIHVPVDRFHYLLPPRRYVKVETKTHQIKIARPYMCFAYLFNYLSFFFHGFLLSPKIVNANLVKSCNQINFFILIKCSWALLFPIQLWTLISSPYYTDIYAHDLCSWFSVMSDSLWKVGQRKQPASQYTPQFLVLIVNCKTCFKTQLPRPYKVATKYLLRE